MLLRQLMENVGPGYDYDNPGGDWTVDRMKKLEEITNAAFEREDYEEAERLEAEEKKLYQQLDAEESEVKRLQAMQSQFSEEIMDSALGNAYDWLNEIGKSEEIYTRQLPFWKTVIDTAQSLVDMGD